jgi:glycosyltransferase involved in cell wall biosynthesis
MRIALIGHGFLPIPAPSWGAVETTIWQRKLCLEKLGHTVDVFNTPLIHQVVHQINRGGYDFVHCHSELLAWACNRYVEAPCALTSHFGGWHRFAPGGPDYPEFLPLFEETLGGAANFVLSARIADVYARRGYRGFLRVMPNAVEVPSFRLADEGNRRAVCVGVVSPRKRQAWLAAVTRGRVGVDFVGPWDPAEEPEFRENDTAKYLGVWDRATLHERLTEYGCLVLLSHSEAAPKVVLEGLAAGLNVVTNEACAANLTDEEFITVLPDHLTEAEVVVDAVQAAIAANPRLRQQIRAYAQERLDYSVVTREYLRLIGEFRAQPTERERRCR